MQHSPARPAPTGARSFDAVVPVVLFLAVNRLAGLRWAVAAATIWSLKVVIDRRRRGQALGVVMPIITLAIIGRGIIGIATDSETVYFGLGIGAKYAAAAALIGSALIRRPLAAVGAPHLFAVDDETTSHPLWRSTMSIITVIAGLYYAVSATIDVVLLQRNSIEGFVLLRFLANWPLSMLTISAAFYVAHRRLPRIPGVSSVAALMEGRLEQIETRNSLGSTENA